VNKTVIIVAGGSGKRIVSEKPKQFLYIGKYPVLQYTIKKFYDFDNNIKIILVLPENYIDYWKKLCTDTLFKFKHEIITGGKERFFSVKNAVAILENTDLVAIHDGVRPFVSQNTIEKAFKTASEKGNAIPYITSIDSVRIEENGKNNQVNRNSIKIIQTPQVFKLEILKKAYNQKYSEDFTDDASVVELLGEKINLIEGNRRNIKITTSDDLLIGELFLKNEE
jgi:2-C-methyl-D-erythritol 4-phosphate cytidylyltransferase